MLIKMKFLRIDDKTQYARLHIFPMKIQKIVHGNKSEFDITFEIVKVFASIKDCA